MVNMQRESLDKTTSEAIMLAFKNISTNVTTNTSVELCAKLCAGLCAVDLGAITSD